MMKNMQKIALLMSAVMLRSAAPAYAGEFTDGIRANGTGIIETQVNKSEINKTVPGETEINAEEIPEDEFYSEDAIEEFTDKNPAEEFTNENVGATGDIQDTEGLEYEYVEKIDGYYVTKGVNKQEIKIPVEYNGKEVMGIAGRAFAGCNQIENVYITGHYKGFRIQKSAFEDCIKLRKVVFRGGISIESHAFYNCPRLHEVSTVIAYDNNNVSIANDAFDSDSKAIVSSDGGLMWREEGYSFFNENGEDAVHEYEQGMEYWDYLKDNGPSEYNGYRVADFDNSISRVRVSNRTDGVGMKAFYGSDKLTEVILGYQNKFIEGKAFAECTNLKKIMIPSSTSVIAEDAFTGCDSLTIYTPEGSFADEFAKTHNIPVVHTARSIKDEKVIVQGKRMKKNPYCLELSWNQIDYADGYQIQYKLGKNGKYKTCKVIKNGRTCNYTVEAWTGQDVTFRVKAYVTENGNMCSYSSYKALKISFWPRAPKIISTEKKSNGRLLIRWKKTAGTTGYQVLRSTDNSHFKCVKTVRNSASRSIIDTGLKMGKTYYYKIRSYRIDCNGKKLYSTEDAYSQITIKY